LVKKSRGEVYIENLRHERRKLARIIPQYIGKYIVTNTVGPVINEKLDKTRILLDELVTFTINNAITE
jgi:hypothetical protein